MGDITHGYGILKIKYKFSNMKLVVISILTSILLCSSTCKKESENCHHNIIIENNSDSNVIFAILSSYDHSCRLAKKDEISARGRVEFHLYKSCWENRLGNSDTQYIYIVDPLNFNSTAFYACDSIEFKNRILKYYALTLNDLKRNNFTVVYQ